MINRFFTTKLIVTITVAMAAARTAPMQTAAVRDCGQAGYVEFLDLDKTGIPGRPENENSSQMPSSKALASRVSFRAERTGFVQDLSASA